MKTYVIVFCVLSFTVSNVIGQKKNHFAGGRNTIVQLFEWHWDAIANECENFLGPKGFAGVQFQVDSQLELTPTSWSKLQLKRAVKVDFKNLNQLLLVGVDSSWIDSVNVDYRRISSAFLMSVSPPNENCVVNGRPWWERYQPVSYQLITRSGDETAFANMVRRCNNAGVRIYVDVVINHMSGITGNGTGGKSSDAGSLSYPGVPFGPNHFHSRCDINNYQESHNIRNCALTGLPDLDQSHEHVRKKIVEYLNHLVDLGVAGFRVDAAKHMWPADLKAIYDSVKDLTGNGLSGRPFVYQEVIDLGGEAVKKTEYTSFGAVLEFKYGSELGNAFQGRNDLHWLKSWGPQWGLLDGLDAVVFIDNHDNQRDGSSAILSYKNPKPYKMATAFMLAHPYGTTRIMSSYAFDHRDQGPPVKQAGFNTDNTCTNGWICEHRWRQIYNMVGFRNAVDGTGINNWWSNGHQQIAFGRGNKGFIAFTLYGDIKQSLQTSLPAGTYCDVISGSLEKGSCTGKTVNVDSSGKAAISLSTNEEDGVVAIHVNAKL